MKSWRVNGFTLVELLVVVAIVGILSAIAIPNYGNYVIKSSRSAAQTELLQLAALEEKIYLNSNAYSTTMIAAYDGTATGGLGSTTGLTKDGKYTLGVTSAGQTFTLTATPVTGSSQASDGILSLQENGKKLWGAANW
jgi:type IV pilus assembly protein PilE